MNRKVKSVSFNLDDNFEKEMYEYSGKYPNFSSFIKRLIQHAVYDSKQQNKSTQNTTVYEERETIQFDKDMMKQML